MQKIRYWYWMLEAWLKRNGLQVIVASLLLAILSAGIYIIVTFVPRNQPEDSFVEGIVGKYVRTKLPPAVMSYLSKGLVRINEQGEPVPELADSIEVQDSGKTYVLKLKKGLYWHDGSELTTKDLAYNIPDVVVEKPDDYTLIFKLRDVFAPFPTLLTSPLIKVTSSNDFFGVGDYQVKAIAFKGTDYLTMLELESATRTPHHITIRFYPTEQDAITALKLGEIQSMTLGNNQALLAWNNLNMYRKTTRRSYVGLYFNMKDNLVGGKEPTIRHALAMAIPPAENEEPFLGPFSKYSWAHTPYESKYKFDINRSKELLDKWKKDTNNQSPQISLSVTPGFTHIADQIKDSWDKVGIQTEIAIHGDGESFQTLLTTQDLPSDPDQYNLWHSTQTKTNITNYSNVRADRDLEEGRKTIDREKRLQTYTDFQKIILEEMPVVYLYHPSNYVVIIKKYDNQAVRQLKGIE